ncbi:hypothetical protein EJ110_NYTH07076 [Nymphaea thermarum]|nr:hypothetical protein EJ110_NYTH07076 [Nymphaea thermarum]
MAPRKAKTIEPEPVGIEGELVRVTETRMMERGESSVTNNKLDLILTQLAGVNQTIAHIDTRLNTLEQRRDPPRSHTSSYYRRNEPIGAVSEAFLGDARRASLGGLGVVPPRARTPDSPHAPIRPRNTRHITHPQLTNETHGEPIHMGERARRGGERPTPEDIRRAFQEARHQNEPYQNRGQHQEGPRGQYENRSNHSMTLGDYEDNLDREIEMMNDTGSTHNFLNSNLAHLVEGKITPQSSFNVLVGNGEKMVCNEVCKGVNLEMQKTPFTIDLYLLPIGGVDLVLGIQWMKPLKRTLLDWENMTLTFPKEGGGEITVEAINPNVKADTGALESPKEVKEPVNMEDLGELGLGNLDPLGLGEEDPSAPCLEDEDPNLPSSDEEDLGAMDLGEGGLCMEERTGDPDLDQG